MNTTPFIATTIEFDGKTYSGRILSGGQIIAPAKLEKLIMKDGKHLSKEAEILDEKILYYATSKEMRLPEHALLNVIYPDQATTFLWSIGVD